MFSSYRTALTVVLCSCYSIWHSVDVAEHPATHAHLHGCTHWPVLSFTTTDATADINLTYPSYRRSNYETPKSTYNVSPIRFPLDDKISSITCSRLSLHPSRVPGSRSIHHGSQALASAITRPMLSRSSKHNRFLPVRGGFLSKIYSGLNCSVLIA